MIRLQSRDELVTRGSIVALVVVASCLHAAPVHAEGRELDYDDQRAVLLLGAGMHGLLFVELSWLAPEACRICATNALDLWIAHRIGSWRHPEVHARVSDALLWSGIGSAVLGSFAAGGGKQGLQDAMIVGQSVLLTGIVTGVVKRVAARQRPGVFLRNPHVAIDPAEANLSLLSGHSSMAAATASSMITLGYMRGYAHRRVVLAVGVAYALAVGTLRITAQRHWLSDALVGLALGAALGALVPLALYPRADAQTQTGPTRTNVPLLRLDF